MYLAELLLIYMLRLIYMYSVGTNYICKLYIII